MELRWYKKGNRKVHQRNFSINNITGGDVLECKFSNDGRDFIASYFPRLDKVEIIDTINNLVYTKDFDCDTDLNLVNQLVIDFINGEVDLYCYEC
jgi:hypothetical protein